MVSTVKGESKKQIGYTPDWLKVSFRERGQDYEITFDIRGEISYIPDGLNCRCKGEIVPWVLYNEETGEEINYEENNKVLSEEEMKCILQKGTYFRLGVFPVDKNDVENAEDDVFTNGICEIRDTGMELRINLDEIEVNL